MWYEVKKINKNFLRKPLDKLIIELAKKIESGLESIIGNLVNITNDIKTYADSLQAKKIGLFGASKIIVSNVLSNANKFTFSVKGSGEVRFIYLHGINNRNVGTYFAQGLFKPNQLSSHEVTIDGVVLNQMPRDNYCFKESFSVVMSADYTSELAYAKVIAVITLY